MTTAQAHEESRLTPQGKPAISDAELPELPPSVRVRAGDPGQDETERLLRLMGGMLADAYADAHQIITEQPRHRTASHLVSHLAREIDSGLRGLLLAMLPPDRREFLQELPREREDSYDPPRSAVIAEICKFLRIADEAGVARIWRRLTWHGRAHRNALQEPRALDDEFLSNWNDFVAVIRVIGERFEASYLAAIPVIDTLAAVEQPTNEDRERLREQIPQNPTALQRFFTNAGSGWFYQLRRARYFDTAQPLRPDDDGLVAYVPWPPGPYLARVAAEPAHAAEVVAVFEALDSDNPQAAESAADVALVVSAPLAARLAPKLAQFLQASAQWSLPSKAAAVAVRLAKESQRTAALTIVQALLPDPNPGGARRLFLPLDAITPAYANLGVDVVRLLADRISAADGDPDNTISLAYSRIWRRSIANDRDRDSRDELVSALRDAAIAVAGAAGPAVVVEVLDQHPPSLFTRITLHILSRFPEPVLVAERLAKAEIIADPELDREYTVLLRQEFPRLPEAAQQSITSLIDVGPTPARSADATEQWRFWQLARMGSALPDRYRDEFDALVAKYGSPAERGDDDLEFAEWPGTQSPFSAADIASMMDAELLTALKDWRGPGGWRAPTVEGLRNQLQEAVTADPARFSALAPQFIDLNPTYGTAVVITLWRLISDERAGASDAQEPGVGHQFAWTPLLDFARAVIDAAHADVEQTSDDGSREQTWHVCWRYIADLLAAGMRSNSIDLDKSGHVLDLIIDLAEDRQPQKRVFLDTYDPIAEALNTVRPLALTAIMQYIRWTSTGPEPREQANPRVVTVLEAHLDPTKDDNPAVRSVYGMYLGVLLTHLPEWTATHHDDIFDTTTSLGEAAWQSFLRANRPSGPTYELLSRQYEAAIAGLSNRRPADDTNRPEYEAVDHLLGHITLLYGWGTLALDSDLIKTLFASTTSIDLRARALEICGQNLEATTEPAPDVVARLQALWDQREAALTAGQTAPDELASIGWWMSSSIVPVDWALAKLETTLRAGGAPEPDHETARRLAELTQTHLPETVRCISLLIDAPTDRWFIDGSHKQITEILTAGVKATDAATRQTALDTINRLVARGRTTFANILT